MFSVITSNGPGDRLTITVHGHVTEESLLEIERALYEALKVGAVVFDFSEVTLVDRAALRRLAAINREAIEVIGCPAYISKWISRETAIEEGKS